MSWLITGSEKNPVDLFRSNVSLLLHGDGTNGSTTIIDSSPTPKTVTAVGNAQISTAQSKFGGASIAFDGNADYLTLNTTSTDIAFGTADFTIEMWIRATTLGAGFGNFSGIIDFRANGAGNSLAPTIYASNTNLLYYVSGSNRIDSGSVLSAGQWYHLAVAKASGVTKLFLDGSQRGSDYTDTNNYISSASRPIIGAFSDVIPPVNIVSWNGHIDEIRITKGIARYTANFTPPIAPFPDI
jgi:hypothetical protein